VRVLLLFGAYAVALVVVVTLFEGGLPLHFHGATATSLCGTKLGPKDYPWPVKPFDAQHAIRGGFGDPRTLADVAFGKDRAGSAGVYSFHNGVDISAAAGTKVYPVVSGWATVPDGDEVRVVAGHRVFQYHHIRPAFQRPRRVVAGVTVLGIVKYPANHVHLTELDGGKLVDPLLHLRPYVDRSAPDIGTIDVSGAAGGPAVSDDLSRRVVITARIDDDQSVRALGHWGGMPVTPAYVGAAIVDGHGDVVWQRTVADFRFSEPPREDFWQVYGRGTFQNFPVFGRRYYWGQPGNYVFRITRAPLQVSRFVDGTYTLEVTAEDLCGNKTRASRPLRFTAQATEAARRQFAAKPTS
jgi:hypothetical protein